MAKGAQLYTEETIQFMTRILNRSGLGDDTYAPRCMLTSPPTPSMFEARHEAELVIFGALNSLFKKTGVEPRDVGIFIVNCSLFNPNPSLSSMIVNRYKLKTDVKTYNLSGMGCSAGAISVDLATNLLKANPNTYAVIVSTENMTLSMYRGNDRSMLVPNCLFRVGGAAVLLSNRSQDRVRSKYELTHLVRTHKGASDKHYTCADQKEDDKGIVGVSLSKELTVVAGDTLKTNLTALGPLVLPLSEKLRFILSIVKSKLLRLKISPYVPDFKLCFEHFCIHAGGRALLDAVEKGLGLMKPAPMPVQFLRGLTGTVSVGYSQPPPGNYDGIHFRLCNIPTKSQRTESVGGLGQQILLHSAEPNQNKPNPKKKEISGSDVLWAIQRATAQRNRSSADRKKKKKEEEVTGVELSSSAGESTKDNGVDYSNVRPLRIKSDWGRRLDEFEKLLKEFRDTEL
ncbi:unnamed protein product [Thlaspi arvense]|uniref:FAE domain-containing protein n=1 Tax=Thlaspi arvense TaxID=13288 RepID=A0AAU9S8T5_THLAR|nr:unnamed protein product [Thlaspi arvense]